MRTFKYVSIIAFVSASSGGAACHAQADRAEHDCKKAIKIVERGKPDKKDEWAWSTVLGCGGEGGIAAHAAWMQTRTESDTNHLEELYSRLWSFRDAALFDAARITLLDASATAESRVYSAMLMVTLVLDRADPTYQNFIGTRAFGVCRIAAVYDRIISAGATLPSDSRLQARLAAQNLLSNPGTPTIVKSASHCVDQAIMINDQIQATKPIVPPQP